jgi:hypothetical protein
MRYALRWCQRQTELAELRSVLEQLAAEGQIATIGEDLYMAWPRADTGYLDTKRKRARIYEMWHAGTKMDEIAAALGTTRGTISVQLSRMRHCGWDLPLRRDWSPKSYERQRHAWRVRDGEDAIGLGFRRKPPPRPRREPRGYSRKGKRWHAYGYEDRRQVHLDRLDVRWLRELRA